MTSRTPWLEPRLPALGVTPVRDYLLRRGWRSRPYPGPELLVFEAPMRDDDGREMILVLPSSERYTDYRMSLADLVGTLAFLEDRPAAAVIDDMIAAGASVYHPTTNDTVGAAGGGSEIVASKAVP